MTGAASGAVTRWANHVTQGTYPCAHFAAKHIWPYQTGAHVINLIYVPKPLLVQRGILTPQKGVIFSPNYPIFKKSSLLLIFNTMDTYYRLFWLTNAWKLFLCELNAAEVVLRLRGPFGLLRIIIESWLILVIIFKYYFITTKKFRIISLDLTVRGIAPWRSFIFLHLRLADFCARNCGNLIDSLADTSL